VSASKIGARDVKKRPANQRIDGRTNTEEESGREAAKFLNSQSAAWTEFIISSTLTKYLPNNICPLWFALKLSTILYFQKREKIKLSSIFITFVLMHPFIFFDN